MAGNSNSGRSGKPAVLHLLDGNKSKKPFSELMDDLTSPAVPIEAPPMPDCLSDSAVAEWERIVPDLLQLGLVAKLDMMALAAYCEAVADWKTFRRRITDLNAEMGGANKGDVQTFKTGATQISVWRQLANDAEKRANAAGSLFGFSPMARRNLKVTPVPQGELFPNEKRDTAQKYFG